MSNQPLNIDMAGENVASSVSEAPANADPIAEVRIAAAHQELQQLRTDLAERDAKIAEMNGALAQLQAQSVPPQNNAKRERGALSARIGADDQTSRAAKLD